MLVLLLLSTETMQVATLSAATAEMVILPFATAVTLPLLSTVATAALPVVQVTVLSLALSG